MRKYSPFSDESLSGSGEIDSFQSILKDMLIVIVLFKTIPEESTAYTSIHAALKTVQSFPDIFIYDNSPQRVPAGDALNAYYCHDPLNPGVSRAYNTASIYAGARQKQWMLLLDQDTEVPRAYFSELQKELDRDPECVAFVPRLIDSEGLVSPFRFSAGRGKRINTPSSRLLLGKHRFINSGLLIKTSAFTAVGGYDEHIPLDFSDVSFGDRLRKITDHFRVMNVDLRHGFSGSERLSVCDALHRFSYFCRGAFNMRQNSRFLNAYVVRAFMRACHLAFRYRDFRFVTEYFKRYAHG